jgi:hypothetical protein
MRSFRKNPHLYEINLLPWLNYLSQREQRKITLETIPIHEWSGLKRKGIDLIWLMGAWQRSPDSQEKARNLPELIKECRSVLVDFEIDDITGSPYAVHEYLPDPGFGSVRDLLCLKETIEDQGLSLILDFVPNHTACDHRWIRQNPTFYIHTGPTGEGRCTDGFFPAQGAQQQVCIAHGKDPYYPPWTDTAQLDYTNPAAMRAMVDTLSDISQYCHGFRCDMAMLVLKSVFRKTWGRYVREDANSEEFWRLAIESIKPVRKQCLWLAEAYWGKEQELIGLGFDYTYDKTLYDLLKSEDVPGLRTHLNAPVAFQERMVRFLENHDELRASNVFGNDKIKAAMVIQSTLPGMRFWHHGQLEGARIRVPIQLRRAPAEPSQRDMEVFSNTLLQEVDHPVFHDGTWQMCETQGWPDNPSHKGLLSWCWRLGEERRLIVVNFHSSPAQGRVRLPMNWLPGSRQFLCRDPITGESYLRSTDEVKTSGLYVGLREWGSHFFRAENT